MLNKQVKMYNLYADAFYTSQEIEIANVLTQQYAKKEISKKLNKLIGKVEVEQGKIKNKKLEAEDDEKNELKDENKKLIGVKKEYKKINRELNDSIKEIKIEGIDIIKKELADTITANNNIRTLNWNNLINNYYTVYYNKLADEINTIHKDYQIYKIVKTEEQVKSNYINMGFDSTLTRAIGVKHNELCEDLIIVAKGKQENDGLFASLVQQGFMYNDELYIIFASSSSELKKGKATFIKKSTLDRIQNKVNCGLTIERINECGGCNTNKYMAYQSLIKSASDRWEGFDIDKVIVVEDIEFNIPNVEVDYIHHQTFEQQKDKLMPSNADIIERKTMDIPYNFTDGIGITTDENITNNIIRMPWIKGLLTYDNFSVWIKENKCKGYITDIWGKKYSMTALKNGEIKYILFKSMFKMWRYYKDWDEYKDNFKKYECEACIVEQEPEYLKNNIRLNYQMLQQLNAIATDEEIDKLAKKSKDIINSIGKDLSATLEVFGVNRNNNNMSNLQRSLLRYPELLKSKDNKEIIKAIKKSRIIDYKSGKLDFEGVMTFVVPDIVAVNQWLFNKENDINQLGVIAEQEVYCNSFAKGYKVDVLRAPSLGFEHNVCMVAEPEEQYKKYFETNAIYTGAKSMLSKVLFFDNDGDKLYAVKDDLLCNLVDRMKRQYSIVPIYFEMEKAKEELINNDTLLEGMLDAFKVCIGEWSNPISKLWDEINNSTDKSNVAEILKIINLFVMYNNFAIDSAKCRFMPTMTDEIDKLQKTYKNSHTKLPHFFVYAKGKKENNVLPIGQGFVDKLTIDSKRITFKYNDGFGKVEFDYIMLLDNQLIQKMKTAMDYKEVVTNIVDEYNGLLEYGKKCKYKYKAEEDKDKKAQLILNDLLAKIDNTFENKRMACNILIDYVYSNGEKNTDLLWKLYGDIIYENICYNIPESSKICPICGTRKELRGKKRYCSAECAEKANRIKTNERKKDKKIINQTNDLSCHEPIDIKVLQAC